MHALKVPFHLHGPHGVLTHLKYLIETKGSAVVCVAEGAGQVSHSLKLIFSSQVEILLTDQTSTVFCFWF